MFISPFRNLIKRAANRTLQTNAIIRMKSTTDKAKPEQKPKSELSESKKLQEAALEEKLFLVDKEDRVVGTASKRDCHKVSKQGAILLHRAFSVFLFNNHGDLLLHKRSADKITFPNYYTNSCCSHPVADIQGEEVEENALGIKRAAQRRLNFELGIPVDQIPIEKFTYLTRFIYKDEGNGQWGEHEIDYVLFLRGDVPVNPNPSEISEISYVPREGFDEYLPTLSGPLSPWFNLIVKHRLRLWWDNLDNLEQFQDHENIHTFDK